MRCRRPPTRHPPDDPDPFPRARAALEALGQVYDPRFAAVAQLETALAAVEDAGMPLSEPRLLEYGRQLREVAEYDLERMPQEPHAAVEYTVLGTALYEPVILALLRLAHQDVAARGAGRGGGGGEPRAARRRRARSGAEPRAAQRAGRAEVWLFRRHSWAGPTRGMRAGVIRVTRCHDNVASKC